MFAAIEAYNADGQGESFGNGYTLTGNLCSLAKRLYRAHVPLKSLRYSSTPTRAVDQRTQRPSLPERNQLCCWEG